jgi:iron complex outermembrane receptor protein
VFATAFRQPGISDLFGGGADAFPALRDPCDGFGDPGQLNDPVIVANCAAQLPNSGRFNADNPYIAQAAGTGQQIRTNVGGNPDLQEETAKTSSFGFVWRPSFLPDVALGADYYSVEVDDPIVNPSSQDKLTDCLESVGLSAPDCADITRLADGGVGLIQVPTENLGKIETKGVDFDISYGLELPLVGPANLSFLGNYVLDYIETDPNGREKQNGFLGIPNFKGRIQTRLQPTDDLSLNFTSRYVGGAKIRDRREQMLPFDNVPSVWYLDTSARYSIDENYSVSFGVRNLGDKRPPFVVNGTNAAGGTYDFLGRYYFARISASF